MVVIGLLCRALTRQGRIQDVGKGGGGVDRVAVVRGRNPSPAIGGGGSGEILNIYRVSEMAFPAF